MDWTRTLLDVIDVRSFSSVWYWLLVALLWSMATHWVLGIPFDVVLRARREGGQALADLEDLVRINVGRILRVAEASGLWLVGIATFVLTGLLILAFWYDVELAQAVVLMAIPLTLVAAMSLATARRLAAEAPEGPDLFRRLARHRLRVQLLGFAAVFVTALYGTYQNLAILPGWG